MSEGYYLVHSCEPDSWDHDDDCNGIFVWAASPEAAIQAAASKINDETLTERMEQLDVYRPVLGDLFGNGYGPRGVEVDKAYREAGFHEYRGTGCECCGLHWFESIPDSTICEDCCMCVECGCECGHD